MMLHLCTTTEITDESITEPMPTEIHDVEEFIRKAQQAEYCAIKRLKKTVKLKLRTPRMLYTLKTNPAKAEEIVKKLACEIREV